MAPIPTGSSCLTPLAHRVLREGETERPFSSPLNDEKRAGTYHCAGCDSLLYTSKEKFESGSGWPSFWHAQDKATRTKRDTSHGMIRDEVVCATCDGHLGHVFPDGPPPTGLRYCMNGAALVFKPA